ncbi:MAG TPA: hypothetical protein VKX28_13685 [Xanthobacteraceae bacterium]|nr:hypothetical protein [Xanthobacteraceae bacterium]
MTMSPGDPHWRPPPPANQPNGCLTAFLILVGVILLIPGVCGIILASQDGAELVRDQTALLIAGGLISLGVLGVVVIWLAIRAWR